VKGHGEKLTRRQEQAIAALLAEPTLAAAAARCGVAETTLWRWMQIPTFEAAFRAAVASLQHAATDAVSCLRRNLDCGQAGAEVRAAAVILEHVLGTLDRMELEERLRRPAGEKAHADIITGGGLENSNLPTAYDGLQALIGIRRAPWTRKN
jgi:Helix-turn-helix domain of transposase family ISL3